MKNLSKLQKSLIVLSALWEIFLISYMSTLWTDDCFFESRVAHFVILSLPVCLYWAGVWIWGFGYLKEISQKLVPLKNNILKRFSFKGKLDRGNFLGLFIFFSIIPYIVYAIFGSEKLVLIVSILCLYGFVNVIIKRANSFTDTPWFFGVVYIVFFVLMLIKAGLNSDGVTIDDVYKRNDWTLIVFQAWNVVGLLWFGMFLYLCFKKSNGGNDCVAK